MDTVKITNLNEPIFPDYNFLVSEFWLPIKEDFDLYKCIPKALQILRDWASDQFGFDFPLEITSTWRPLDKIDGPPAHRLTPPAVDHICSKTTYWEQYRDKIRNEMKNRRTSVLIQSILDTGLNVILFEPSCIHLHWRDGKNASMGFNNHPDDSKWPFGIYLGEWEPNGTPEGHNETYSI